MKDINWFKEEIEPYLEGYEIKYKFFEKGDFGSLNQVEFNAEKLGGEIDFWSTGWLGVHLVDYIKGKELLNVFLEPHQEEEKENAFKRLQEFL
ncbi:hypothetical protein [Flavobacterium inviolabile]|uniref:hypothetical protein n=1 Tax=Flavobacterium inviolabile TaxID=2748320 RepID=UPI0015AB6339|nr:hypothetical protein [Flavobacterium inviolabile]